MANTSVTYTGNGAQTQFTVPFPYISQSHVKVDVNTIEVLNPGVWYFDTASTIRFRNAPLNGAAIKIYRETPGDTRLVDFQNGAVLTEAELDLAVDQVFYLAQEAKENYAALVNGELTRIGTPSGIIETEPDLIIAGLVEKMLEDANAANLQARINDIDTNAEAIISLGTNLQIQLNTLAQGIAALVWVQATAPVPGVGGVPDPIPDGSRWYDSDDNNAPYLYDGGLGGWISIQDPRIGDAYAYIQILETNYGVGGTALVNELTAMSNATTNVASELALLGAQNGTQTAFIIDSSTVKLDSDVGDTLATRFSQLSATDGSLQGQITSEQTARISGDSVLASDIALIGAKNGAGTAFIMDTSTVKIDADGGDTFATRLTALTAADSANSAAITTINTVTIPGINSDVDTLEAKYGVSLNVNGYITGFVQNNNGTSGEFVILADKFAVVDPSGDPGETQYVPFSISGGKINMTGDVSINGNLLVAGSITTSGLDVNATFATSAATRILVSSTSIGTGANLIGSIAVPVVQNGHVEITAWGSYFANHASNGYVNFTIRAKSTAFTGTGQGSLLDDAHTIYGWGSSLGTGDGGSACFTRIDPNVTYTGTKYYAMEVYNGHGGNTGLTNCYLAYKVFKK